MNTNPLKFWCPPNGATPDYIQYTDLYAVLGFLCLHDDSHWAELVVKQPEFRNFIKEIHLHVIGLVEAGFDGFVASFNEGELEPDGSYDPDDFGGVDYTTVHMLDEADAAEAGREQVQCNLSYRVDVEPALRPEDLPPCPSFFDAEYWRNKHAAMLREHYVMMIDINCVTTAWWEIDVHKTNWASDFKAEFGRARKDLERAWMMLEMTEKARS